MKINIENYEALLIDYMEGGLNDAEIQQLKAFCTQNNIDFEELTENLPVLESSSETYNEKESLFKNGIVADDIDEGQYILKPDTSIVFKDKESLKKKAFIVPLYAKIAAAVAVIALLFGLFWLPKTENSNSNEQPILVELTTETNESYLKDTIISPENSSANKLNEECRNVYENEQIASNGNIARHISTKQQNNENQRNSSFFEKEENECHIENETEDIQPISTEPELLASLEPRMAKEIIVSEDFAIENGLLPEMAYLLPANDYYLAQNQEWVDEDDYENYEQHLSLIGRGINWLSQGRYTSIGEAISDGLRIGRREVVELSEQAVAIAYIKADEGLNEIKTKWEERIERKDE